MSTVLDEFKSLIPANRRISSKGWYNFCCPACGDKRYRGGFNYTPTGGFRYYCFNGGCEFNTRPTGWEPDMGFGGRPRKLYELLGGDIRRIPVEETLKWSRARFNSAGEIVGEEKELEVVTKFPTVDLPRGSELIVEAAKTDKRAMKVFRYLVTKNKTDLRTFPFMWTPKHPDHLIIPFFHYNDQIVGWLGRSIKHKFGPDRFIGYAPNDYMFNQHLLSFQSSRYVFVLESPMDALSLRCLASRGDRMTEKQINLLKLSGKDVILIPDLKQGEGETFIDIAEKHKWFVAVPDFITRNSIKDVGDSIYNSGRLFTIEAIMKERTKKYLYAREMFKVRSVK